MNGERSYVEADSTNLPKVDTWMLFNFLKNGRKFSYAEFENDKENRAIEKYGDDSIGYVMVLRNSAGCVVKAEITGDNDEEPCISIRALIYETKNYINKIECRKCNPIECIHSFALLMWLHRRSEETVDGSVVNYYKKPGTIRTPKQDSLDYLLTPKSSSVPSTATSYSCSPDTKLFLHGNGMLSQSSSQHSQTVFRTSQPTSQISSQKSNSGSDSSQISNSKIENSVPTLQPSQKFAVYSTQLSQTMYQASQHVSGSSPQKSSPEPKYSQLMVSRYDAREYCEAENQVSTKSPPCLQVLPLSQITNKEHAIISPKQLKTVRNAPYTQKPTKGSPPDTSKKQTLLSKKVSQLVKQPKIDNFFTKPKTVVEDSKPQIKNLFMGQLVKNFVKLNKGTLQDFMMFAENQMTGFLCQEAEKLTRLQSRTDLWMELRYGRITASIIHEAACCRTTNGSLVNKVLGKAGRYQSPAMKRGIDLEGKILQQVQIQENFTTSTSGLFLIPSCPIIGASPDAIGKDFIVEIKAPSSDNSFETFLPSGNISKKCKSQMYLQMHCTGMKKGIFCVADPNFERNKKVTTVWLDYNEAEFAEVLEKAKIFWIEAIFPKLVNLH